MACRRAAVEVSVCAAAAIDATRMSAGYYQYNFACDRMNEINASSVCVMRREDP